jgi:DNA ligase-1
MAIISDAGDVTVVSYSRNGKIFENFTHIENQIQDNFTKIVRTAATSNMSMGFVLDGEVIGNSFQELMRQARRKTDVQAEDSVFNVFDIIPLAAFREGHWNAQLSKRIKILESLRPVVDAMPNVELLPHLMVDLDTSEGRDQLDRYAADQVEAGFEGIMIKDLDAPYECKRSTSWMKYKPVYDYDLTVIGIEEGTGKNLGRMGALVCEGVDDGKNITVNVGSGYTDEERQSYWNDKSLVIGQTAVVMADAITQNRDGTYSLRFPRFKTFRDDK